MIDTLITFIEGLFYTLKDVLILTGLSYVIVWSVLAFIEMMDTQHTDENP